MNLNPEMVFDTYIKTIQGLDHPNNKLYVAFSAVTGSGKSWLAKRIAERFSGLYLSADDFRASIKEVYPTISRPELDQFVARHAPFIQDRLLGCPNQLHIVDTNIDKYTQQVIDKADSIGYPLFIIRLEVSRHTLEQRIMTRQQNEFQDHNELFAALDQNLLNHEVFLKNFSDYVSYTFTEGDDPEGLLLHIEETLLSPPVR